MSISLMNPSDHVPTTDSGFGALETPRGCLPLTRLDVRADLDGLTSRVTLRQTFVNGFDEPLEATYIFPLPDRGAVSSFTLNIAGRRVDGVLKERGQARQDYDRAIASGHRAAIAEEERPDVFTMRAGNIAPGESAVVELEIIAPLEVISSEATFRFPLVVAPRYIPGTPLPGSDVGSGQAKDTDAVPDASRISPPVLLQGSPNPVALSIEVDIDTGSLPLRNLRSSLHAIDSERSAHRAHVRVQPGERVDRDFILRFDVGHEAETSASCLVLERPGRTSILNLELVAPIEEARAQRPRDVVFILDRSGSMSGWKMLAARRALGRMVDTLTPSDRFNILAFDNNIETMPGTDASTLLQATNRNRWKALEFLASVDARGGTEMARPLSRGADQLAGGYQDRDRVLVLLTDGQVGNEDQILADLGPRLSGTRVFTVGIDRAVNAGFLGRLADLGAGHFELVESEDRLDEVMDRIHHHIDTPWLTEITLDLEGGGDLDTSSLTPHRISGLFCGTPLRLRGEIAGPMPSHVILRGARADGSTWSCSIPVQPSTNTALGSLYARGRIRALEDAYLMPGASKTNLESQIVALSLEHQVLCRFTSFVAVDHAEVLHTTEPMRQVTQPVETPSGWGAPQKTSASVGRRRKTSKRKPMVEGSRGAQPSRSLAAPAPGFSGVPAGPPPAAPAAPMPQHMDYMSTETGAMAPAEATLGRLDVSDSFADFAKAEADMEEEGEANIPTQAPSMTRTGSVSPWAHLMSPERMKGDAPTEASNIYALGALLYHLLTGRTLFGSASMMEAMARVLRGELPEPLFQGTDDPAARAFATIIRRAVAHDPGARHASLAALARDIDAAIEALAAATSLSEHLATLRARGERITTLAELTRSRPRPHVALAALLADLARALDGQTPQDLDLDQITLTEQGTLEVPSTPERPALLVRLSRFLRGEKPAEGRGSFWK